MKFNGLAHIEGITLSPARQFSPGKGALCGSGFAGRMGDAACL